MHIKVFYAKSNSTLPRNVDRGELSSLKFRSKDIAEHFLYLGFSDQDHMIRGCFIIIGIMEMLRLILFSFAWYYIVLL